MNPQMQQIPPQIRAMLMLRRMGGVGGGGTAPAGQQVMAPNPLGGPLGPSASPLQTSPQAIPGGSIPLSMQSSSGPGSPGMQRTQPGMQRPSAPQTAQIDDETRTMTKALMQRLLRYI